MKGWWGGACTCALYFPQLYSHVRSTRNFTYFTAACVDSTKCMKVFRRNDDNTHIALGYCQYCTVQLTLLGHFCEHACRIAYQLHSLSSSYSTDLCREWWASGGGGWRVGEGVALTVCSRSRDPTALNTMIYMMMAMDVLLFLFHRQNGLSRSRLPPYCRTCLLHIIPGGSTSHTTSC